METEQVPVELPNGAVINVEVTERGRQNDYHNLSRGFLSRHGDRFNYTLISSSV